MTSPDQELSLDELFAAVGVSAPEPEADGSEAEKPSRKASSTSRDTTEQDLLSALGISHARTIEKQAAQEGSVDAESVDKRDRAEEQKVRASQWRQELQEAGGSALDAAQSEAPSTAAADASPASMPETASPSASDEAFTQSLQATVKSLPTLSGSTIRPFGSDAGLGSIGVLEQAHQPSQAVQTPTQPLPTHQDAHPMQPWQGVSPKPAAMQPSFAPQGEPFQDQVQGQAQPQPWPAQPFQHQPQAAFQQAQQMPLQSLRPIDQQPQASVSPQAASSLGAQSLQQRPEGAPFQSVEQQVAQEAMQPVQPDQAPQAAQPVQPVQSAQSAQTHLEPSAQQQPLPGQPQPLLQPQSQPMQMPMQGQPMPYTANAQALWQQQMAQRASMVPDQAEQQPESPQTEAQPLIQTAEPEPSAQPALEEAPAPSVAPEPEQVPHPPAQPLPFGETTAPQAAVQPQGPPLMPPPAELPQQPASSEVLDDLDRESKSSLAAHIVGGILIFIAVVCVIFAICLLTGVLDLSAINSNQAAQTGSSNTQLSGQAAPSATTTESSSGVQAMTSESGSKAGDVVYSYVVRGVDGGTHETIETATFGEDGKLVSSSLEIQTESQMDSDKLLDQLTQEFGESLVESSATEDKVLCTVQLPRDDLDRESYTELLSTNAPEFKIISS